MGTKERRQREREGLRQKILETARELFIRDGYEAVTMRSLAKAIEYSPTAIYLHFKDKESLFYELCALDMKYLETAILDVSSQIENPLERLRAIGHAYVKFALEHPGQYRLLFLTRRPVQLTAIALAKAEGSDLAANKGSDVAANEERCNEMTGPELEAYGNLRRQFSDLIDLDLIRPDMKDADLLAQTYWCGLHGIVATYVALCVNEAPSTWSPADTLVDFYIEALMRGVIRVDQTL